MKTMILIIILIWALCGCDRGRDERIKTLQREVTSLREQLAAAKQDAAEEKARGDEWFETSGDLAKKFVDQKNENLNQQILHEKLLGLYEKRGETIGKLEALQKTLQDGGVARSNYVPVPSGMQSRATSNSEPPGWRYPTVHEAKEFVKRDAKAKWNNNYRMVEYDITRQMEAYEKLKTYEAKRWSDPAIRSVLNDAGNKWGANYGMILHEVSGQLEAKDRLKSEK